MSSTVPLDVSIVMPCLNEAVTLPRCIEEAHQALASLKDRYGLTGEIVVADNGSSDDSWSVANRLGAVVVLVDQPGYGNALIGGLSAARGRFLVMGDADCSYDFREAVAMVAKLLDGYDICMGSRLAGRILPEAMPWKNRYIGNPALTGILNLLFRSGLSDAHCGLRAFTKEAFERMRLSATGMEFASEMVIKSTLVGLRRTELPITLRPDGRSRPPHLRPWRDGWRHLRYLFMLSPAWLFFAPAALCGWLGLAIATSLLSRPDLVMVPVGPFLLGDHWMVIAGGLLMIAHQAAIFGLATCVYGVQQRYRRSSESLVRYCRIARLERMLMAGLVIGLCGGGVLVYVFTSWAANGYQALSMVREMIAGMTLVLIGIQNMFGGFLLSIIGGNEANVDLVAKRRMAEDGPPDGRDETAPAGGTGAERGSAPAAEGSKLASGS